MPVTPEITTEAEHKQALDRVSAMMNNCANDAEVEELRALARAVHDYEWERSWLSQVQTDGADHLEFMLDEGQATLDELIPVFGGMEPFLAFMTRKRNLEPETLEALVSQLSIRREDLDKPFCTPEGWQDITLEDVDCCDDDPCPMGIGEWRERLLAERERMEAVEARRERVGAGRTVQDVGAVAAD